MKKNKLEVGNKAVVYVGNNRHPVKVIGEKESYVILSPTSRFSTYGKGQLTEEDCEKFGIDIAYVGQRYGMYHKNVTTNKPDGTFDWVPPTSVSR